MSANTISRQPAMCLVISTGRCGSTLISSIIRAHPMALSISELFSGIRDCDLADREITGAEFWSMVSTSSPTDVAVLRCGLRLDEMLYPAFDPRPGASRFSARTGLPPLMQACIPHLTSQPDEMFAALEAATPALPEAPLSSHLWWLFGQLAQGRRPAVVVERSGGSLAYAGELLRLFPQARVVHLYRDGRECALSMSKHGRYKLAMIRSLLTVRLGYDPYLGPLALPAGDDAQAAGPELAGLLPERVNQAAYEGFQAPLANYGRMWSKMIAQGLPELPAPPRLLPLDYRDLLDRPEETIGTLLDFLGLERDPVLEKEMASQVRPPRDARAAVADERWNELTQACRLGMNRLYGRNRWQ